MELISEKQPRRENGPTFNPRRRQRQITPLRMLPSTSARITRSLTDSTDFIIIIIIAADKIKMGTVPGFDNIAPEMVK